MISMPDTNDNDATSGAMVHEAIAPISQLRGLVRRVLFSRSTGDGSVQVPVPPTGAIYLTHIVRGSVRIDYPWGAVDCPDFYFGGQLLRELPIATIEQPTSLVGIEFHPTGFYRAFGTPAFKLTDRAVPIEELDIGGSVGSIVDSVGDLRRQLAAARQPRALTRALQKWLADHARSDIDSGPADRAVEIIEAAGGVVDIAELAAQCGISQRHLARLFRQQVGVPPKHFAKVVQLNSVVDALHRGERSLAQVAVRHGYFDQAHFSHDFQRFVGSNPMPFLRSQDPFLQFFLGRSRGN